MTTEPTDAELEVKPIRELTAARLRELIDYDHVSGKLYWKVTRGAAIKGGKAGSLDKDGYLYLRVEGKKYPVHRLAWLHAHGAWPSDLLDHINREKTDNRIANLRVVNRTENNQNTPILRNNTSGYRGVTWCKSKSKWEAKIKHNGKHRYIGRFDRVEDAYQAYLREAERLHTCNPCVLSPSLGIKAKEAGNAE